MHAECSIPAAILLICIYKKGRPVMRQSKMPTDIWQILSEAQSNRNRNTHYYLESFKFLNKPRGKFTATNRGLYKHTGWHM